MTTDLVIGYHSEWNLGSPGGWDYQRITQEIGKAVWKNLFRASPLPLELDFDHPLLYPVNGFVAMLSEAQRSREGTRAGLIAVVAEEETLDDVVENKNLARQLNALDGLSSALMAPHELHFTNGRVCWNGQPVSLVFMDFNTDVLLQLHRKHNLAPLLQAVREGRVINPRGTEPINVKSMFELITDHGTQHHFHKETIDRTPWTRQFYARETEGPGGEKITDLIEWTRQQWDELVLKPERGYSGKGVRVGGVHQDGDAAIELALSEGSYIVQKKVPLNLWAEEIPELDVESGFIKTVQYQTDFRCLFGAKGLFGFLCRYGNVPTNVGSGGGVQPLAVLRSDMTVREATERMNDAILGMAYGDVVESLALQKSMAMDHQFTYLLGPIKIALRPRLITPAQMDVLAVYCADIWKDCLKLESMWVSGEIDPFVKIEPEELEIARSQPWRGSPAIFASDGIFSFGAHRSLS